MAHESGGSFYNSLNHASGMRNIRWGPKGLSDFQYHYGGDANNALTEINVFVETWTDAEKDIEDWNGAYLWKEGFSFANSTEVYLKVEWRDNEQEFQVCSCHPKGK